MSQFVGRSSRLHVTLYRDLPAKTRKCLFYLGTCYQLLDQGGLGIRKLAYQNTVFLMMLGFRLLSNPEALWVKILRKKHNIQETIPGNIARSNCSFIWKSLMRIWPDIIKNVYWSVGDGRLISSWDDVWLRHNGPLR